MKKIFMQIVSILSIVVLFVLIFIYGAFIIVYKSDNVRTMETITLTLLETSAANFIPELFLSPEEIADIISRNTAAISEETTNTELVEIVESSLSDDSIELVEISGSTYQGRLLIISDPSRIYMATPTEWFDQKSGGMTVVEMVERDGAIAGINAGGFEDKNGRGNGSIPTGYVIQDGVIVYGEEDTIDCVTGFDENNILIVGRMSAQEALDAGIVNGFCFNLNDVSALIVNGEPVEISGTGGGLNPRTAIGQTADGTIILLTIDGRQAHSLGATYSDLIDIFMEYGVVNASNLDGGSSSIMVYEGEVISVSSSLYGDREIPTAILVN